MTTTPTTPSLTAIWIHSILTGAASAACLVLGYWIFVCDGLFTAMVMTVFVTPTYGAFVPTVLSGVIGFGAAATVAARAIVIDRRWRERMELLIFPFSIGSAAAGYVAASVMSLPVGCSLGQWR